MQNPTTCTTKETGRRSMQEMHTSDALSRLKNIADMPNNKDVTPLNFLQHLARKFKFQL